MAKYASEDYICIVTGKSGADIHHIFSRKAHPEYEHKEWNQIKISHFLHQLWHSKGTNYMSRTYPAIEKWLKDHGWFRCAVTFRYDHERERLA